MSGDCNVELQARTFDLLAFLVVARGRVVSREELQAAVWPNQVVVANNLTVQMSLLRGALAQHGHKDAILTLPGRGYRFVGEMEEVDARPAPAPAPVAETTRASVAWAGLLRRRAMGRRAMGLPVGGLVAGVVLGLAAAFGAVAMRHGPAGFVAHVRVVSNPDELYMVPEGYCRVDYRFWLDDPGELQLMTEDVRFNLTSGEPVSELSVRGRIYQGSFPIRRLGTGVYHNNLYLPGKVLTAARANGRYDVYLHHLFHLQDPAGREVSVPAVVRIVFGTPAQACTLVRDADLPH